MDSHLLPKALTKAEGLGPGLIQMGNGRTERRSSSWYDPQLVTQAGERILAEYDNWAIQALRLQQLVWSGWGPMQELQGHTPFGPRMGIRKLTGGDWKKLRLFFLSLLWRAGATDRVEFCEVTIPEPELEQLRLMLINKNPYPLEFYPVSLTQFSTIGVGHNLVPLAKIKQMPNLEDGSTLKMPFFRFYMDGLIAHILRLSPEENRKLDLGPLAVGSDEHELIVSTVPWEGSSQQQNGFIVMMEAALGRPLWETGAGPFSPPTSMWKSTEGTE